MDWDIKNVLKEMIKELAGQKKLKDEFKDPSIFPEVNETGMAGSMEAIKQYLRLCHGAKKALLVNIVKKKVVVHPFATVVDASLTTR